MIQSKAWNWEISKEDIWEEPCEDLYYYIYRWKNKKFKSILDLGCGMGRNTLLLAENDFSVSGIDLSEYGVNKTIDRISSKNLKANVICGDINSLPYENNAFDALLAYHVISHTDSSGIYRILDEMKRVVKNRGELYFTLCSKQSPSFSNPEYSKIDENTIIKKDGPEENIPHFYTTEDQLPSLLCDMKILKLRHTKDIYNNSYSWHYFILCENLK
mgnify:CR=1 FL=1